MRHVGNLLVVGASALGPGWVAPPSRWGDAMDRPPPPIGFGLPVRVFLVHR